MLRYLNSVYLILLLQFAFGASVFATPRSDCINSAKAHVSKSIFVVEGTYELTPEMLVAFEEFRKCVLIDRTFETTITEAPEYNDYLDFTIATIAAQLYKTKVTTNFSFPFQTVTAADVQKCAEGIRDYNYGDSECCKSEQCAYNLKSNIESYDPRDDSNPWRNSYINASCGVQNRISKVYAHEIRFAYSSKNKNKSTALDAWKFESDGRLQGATRRVIVEWMSTYAKPGSLNTPVNTTAVTRSLESYIRKNLAMAEVGNFPLVVLGSVLKTLSDVYNLQRPWKMIDPSAGWGDRLTAALGLGATKVSYYIGIDPFEQLHKQVYPKIIGSMSGLYPMGQAQMIQSGSEVMNYYVDESAGPGAPFRVDGNTVIFAGHHNRPNLIFTSPPYFDTETYGLTTKNPQHTKRSRDKSKCISWFPDSTQSVAKFPSKDQWVEGFLRPTLEKHFEILEEGGFLVYVLSDTTAMSDLNLQFVNIMKTLPGSEYLGCLGLGVRTSGIGRDRGTKKCEPIWIWRKSAGGGGGAAQASGVSDEEIDRMVDEAIAHTQVDELVEELETEIGKRHSDWVTGGADSKRRFRQ